MKNINKILILFFSFLILYCGKSFCSYTELDYIESTGTQYIDTLVTMGIPFKFELDYSLTDTSTSSCIICSGGGFEYKVENHQFKIKMGAHTRLWIQADTNRHLFSYNSYNFSDNRRYSDYILTLDDYSLSGQEEYGIANQNLFLCSNTSGSGTKSKIKIYGLKIYRNQTDLISDFIPVLNNDNNKVCLYDKVNGQYYYNLGTGDFIADVPSLVLPDIQLNVSTTELTSSLTVFTQTLSTDITDNYNIFYRKTISDDWYVMTLDENNRFFVDIVSNGTYIFRYGDKEGNLIGDTVSLTVTNILDINLSYDGYNRITTQVYNYNFNEYIMEIKVGDEWYKTLVKDNYYYFDIYGNGTYFFRLRKNGITVASSSITIINYLQNDNFYNLTLSLSAYYDNSTGLVYVRTQDFSNDIKDKVICTSFRSSENGSILTAVELEQVQSDYGFYYYVTTDIDDTIYFAIYDISSGYRVLINTTSITVDVSNVREYMSVYSDELQAVLHKKFGFFYTSYNFITSFFDRVEHYQEEPPTLTITLPEIFGGQTLEALDLSFYKDYRPLIFAVIIFTSYFFFCRSLLKRLIDRINKL